MKFCPMCGSQLQWRDSGEQPRLVCPAPACGFVHWNNPTPVVAALVYLDDQVVLARNATWPEGFFSLITGYLEENETPADCVVREVREELNLEVLEKTFIGHYIFKAKNQLIIAFAVRAEGEIKLNEELLEFIKIPAPELTRYDFKPLYISQAIVTDWLKRKTNPDGMS